MSSPFKVLVSDEIARRGLDILRASPRIALDVSVGMAPADLVSVILDELGDSRVMRADRN